MTEALASFLFASPFILAATALCLWFVLGGRDKSDNDPHQDPDHFGRQ